MRNQDEIFDVCIVGSGAGGGMSAYMLTKAGLKVAVLEKGRYVHRDQFAKDEIANNKRNIYVPKTDDEYFTAEYRTVLGWKKENKKLNIWQGNVVGGSSNFMSGFFHRFKPIDFKLFSTFGEIDGANIVDWPITYDEMEPYYTKVEEVIGISGKVTHYDGHEPRSTNDYPYPPLIESEMAKEVDIACKKLNFTSYKLPRAIITKDKEHRNACVYSTTCGGTGCSSGARGSAREALIVPAIATGNLTLIPNAFVKELIHDENGKIVSAKYIQNKKEEKEIRAKLFIVSAQAHESCRLLLNSKSNMFPNGLANNNNQVGKNLLFGGGGIGFATVWKDDLQNVKLEDTHNSTFLHRTLVDWYEIKDKNMGYCKGGTIDFLLADVFNISDVLTIDRQKDKKYNTGAKMLYGKALQKKIFDYTKYSRRIKFDIFVDWMPTDNSYITVDNKKKDIYGQPVSQIRIDFHPQQVKISEYLSKKAIKLLTTMGVKIENIDYKKSNFPSTNLVAGGCRFGNDPKTSVLNKYCQTHEVKNLFVVDGSFLPNDGSVPHTWTIYANAMRVGEYIGKNFKEIINA